jgi:hypothetical protein
MAATRHHTAATGIPVHTGSGYDDGLTRLSGR